MDVVYKYCGAFGADILRHQELKITPPNQFNDQLEFTPKITCSDPVGWAKRTLTRDHIHRTLYELVSSSGKFSGGFSEFQQNMKRPPPRWIECLAGFAQDQGLSAAEEMDFISQFSKFALVLCLSQNRDSVLMWGHYCDKPLGLVIGFDKSAAVFQQAKAMRPVDYVKERVVLDMSWELGAPGREKLGDKIMDQLIFSKSAEWCYEQELRQAFQLSDFGGLRARPLSGKGTLGYFLPIGPEVIVSVTLGPRCSPEQESYVRAILKDSRLRHVRLDRARVDEDNFTLRFEPIS